MEAAKAVIRYIHTSPRRARQVVDLIRGKKAEEALAILSYTPRAAARIVEKLLKSAIANAGQNERIDVDSLVVARAWVDGGPMIKRFLPRARGRATPIRKRTSHITLVLSAQERPVGGRGAAAGGLRRRSSGARG
ncbi:MAG: 50S ribosomal protein L22 [Candidatus Tectomicrobia bacterium]|uniref:Large ribosomal subunit protein uL22 n=1 Tax=Tectimicrobiota bacterium TaxID=2528274 RepID=A0A932CNN1_UNCTE|nr:50S ribosomal protein L22 [Candidatus Tectomicrobia bacterium]